MITVISSYLRLSGPLPRGVALALALGTLIELAGARAADWPQYRGPTVNGKSPEPVAASWPAGGLRQIWKVPTTTGFSTFTVSDGRAFTLMAREIDGAKREVCVAFDAATGKELWAAPLSPAKYDGGGDSGTPENKGGDGPRSTPAIRDDFVYVLDSRLTLACLEAPTGKPVWSVDLVKTHGAKNISWQNAASPLIDGDLIYVCCGAEGGSLMALDPRDGSVVWKGESDKMTHATPVPATFFSTRQIIFFTQTGLVATEAVTGKVLWRHPFRYSVSTAASPVVADDIVYCSAGYGVGSAAIRVSFDTGKWSVQELWRVADNKIASHWSTPVVKSGHLFGMFGFKEYGTGALKCIELATGKEKWAQPNFGPGGVLLAGTRLIALNDRGELVLIDPQPENYKEISRMKAVAGKCWNHPTLSGGRLYARSTQEGVCLDAGAPGK